MGLWHGAAPARCQMESIPGLLCRLGHRRKGSWQRALRIQGWEDSSEKGALGQVGQIAQGGGGRSLLAPGHGTLSRILGQVAPSQATDGIVIPTKNVQE